MNQRGKLAGAALGCRGGWEGEEKSWRRDGEFKARGTTERAAGIGALCGHRGLFGKRMCASMGQEWKTSQANATPMAPTPVLGNKN